MFPYKKRLKSQKFMNSSLKLCRDRGLSIAIFLRVALYVANGVYEMLIYSIFPLKIPETSSYFYESPEDVENQNIK